MLQWRRMSSWWNGRHRCVPTRARVSAACKRLACRCARCCSRCTRTWRGPAASCRCSTLLRRRPSRMHSTFRLSACIDALHSHPQLPRATRQHTHPAPAMPNLFLLPLTPRSSRLQAVSDIADLVSARSRAALSVPAQRPAPPSRRTPPLPPAVFTPRNPAARNMHALPPLPMLEPHTRNSTCLLASVKPSCPRYERLGCAAAAPRTDDNAANHTCQYGLKLELGSKSGCNPRLGVGTREVRKASNLICRLKTARFGCIPPRCRPPSSQLAPRIAAAGAAGQRFENRARIVKG